MLHAICLPKPITTQPLKSNFLSAKYNPNFKICDSLCPHIYMALEVSIFIYKHSIISPKANHFQDGSNIGYSINNAAYICLLSDALINRVYYTVKFNVFQT
jgi:hypothetical protein